MGSKRRIADEILPLMLDKEHDTFVDAFCGGCGVITHVPPSYRRIANVKKDVPLLEGIEFVSYEYDELPIPPHCIIYCDPPYRQTRGYRGTGKFNYESFHIWCMEMALRGHRVFISEYEMPSPFRCVWEKEVANAICPNRKATRPIERLFTID